VSIKVTIVQMIIYTPTNLSGNVSRIAATEFAATGDELVFGQEAIEIVRVYLCLETIRITGKYTNACIVVLIFVSVINVHDFFVVIIFILSNIMLFARFLDEYDPNT
jgi:uncharacterized membrane protein YecN with MAPEG domain